MIPRNRSRAAGSSFAAPRSVSMKPISAVRGVRSSWLTFATKSRRIRLASTSSDRSRSTHSAARPSGVSMPVTATVQVLSVPSRDTSNRASSAPARPASTSASAARKAGARRPSATLRPGCSAGSITRTSALVCSTRSDSPTTMAGSGIASIICCMACL